MEQTRNFPDLPRVAEAYGYEVFRQGKSFAANLCPECGESSAASNKFSMYLSTDQKWRCNCFNCGFHGDVVDFVAAVESVTLGKALRILTGDRIGQSRVALQGLAKTSRHIRKTKDLSAVVEVCRRMSYFHDRETLRELERRGIPRQIIRDAISARHIAALPSNPRVANKRLLSVVGKELLVRAGMLGEGKDWCAAAFRPLVGLLDTAIQFSLPQTNAQETKGPRFLIYGEVRWPFVFRRRLGGLTAFVEGYVDAMSLLAMRDDIDAVVAIPGVRSWKDSWLQVLAKKYPEAILLIGMDADVAGDSTAMQIFEAASKYGLRAKRIRPNARGGVKHPINDWNDVLRFGKQVAWEK